jgi:hypothetical protein
MSSLHSPLFEQIQRGGNRQLQMLAAQGLLPLGPSELIPLQVSFTRAADSDLASTAAQTLQALPAAVVTAHLREDADADALRYFAAESTNPLILESILRRRDVPRDLLAEMAPRLGPDLQEILLLRQDAIVESPRILDRLEENPQLSQYTLRRVLEYREHLLPRDRSVSGRATAADIPALADPEVQAAIAEARALPASGEHDEELGLSEGQIRSLPVPVRLKLARGAPRLLRGILIKDSSSMVALAVLDGSAMSEQEIEMYAGSRAVIDEVLDYIARKNEWVRKYPVRLALVTNPRTSVGLAVRLMSVLSVKDLRKLSKDRNISDAVRNTAQRLYRIKAI